MDASERCTKDEEKEQDRTAYQHRSPHHHLRTAEPESVLERSRAAGGRPPNQSPDRAAQVPGVNAWAEDLQQRGK